MRNPKKGEYLKSLADKEKLSLKVVQLDVTDERSVKNAIQSITTEASTIDLLVNNAGYGLGGAFEDLELTIPSLTIASSDDTHINQI
jgi:NADP-dependent 3-hydroxy acid dehydrogenase YdfG